MARERERERAGKETRTQNGAIDLKWLEIKPGAGVGERSGPMGGKATHLLQPCPHHLPAPLHSVCRSMRSVGFLLAVNPKKAADPDGVPGKVPIASAYQLTPTFGEIYNLSLDQAFILRSPKSASIIPESKKAPITSLNDYHTNFERQVLQHIKDYDDQDLDPHGKLSAPNAKTVDKKGSISSERTASAQVTDSPKSFWNRERAGKEKQREIADHNLLNESLSSSWKQSWLERSHRQVQSTSKESLAGRAMKLAKETKAGDRTADAANKVGDWMEALLVELWSQWTRCPVPRPSDTHGQRQKEELTTSGCEGEGSGTGQIEPEFIHSVKQLARVSGHFTFDLGKISRSPCYSRLRKGLLRNGNSAWKWGHCSSHEEEAKEEKEEEDPIATPHYSSKSGISEQKTPESFVQSQDEERKMKVRVIKDQDGNVLTDATGVIERWKA
ncbi:unnamed protein product [Menidia menidia]|uniref:(Atlantic silverside) hypothetical protein n=1 Tax=Menidia menidia TaxID=238744 RepID=A0A8S4ALI6_9TELE|nr:unnamed protein product [Menidia menidia]